jgi:hypothetical protein
VLIAIGVGVTLHVAKLPAFRRSPSLLPDR